MSFLRPSLRIGLARSILLAAMALVVGSAEAQFGNPFEMVRGYYREYLKRDPSRQEDDNWVREMRAGMSPLEVQARILGSDEYWLRFGNQPGGVIAGYYQDVLGRNPSPAEMNNWLIAFRRFNGSHIDLARAFVNDAQAELNRRPPPNPPNDLGGRLVAAAELSANAAQTELMGHPRGRQVSVRANALVAASRDFRRVYSPPYLSSRELREFNDVQASFQALQESLVGLAYVAPRTSYHVNQVGELIQSIAATIPVPPVPGPAPLPPFPGPGFPTVDVALYNQLNRLSFQLSRSTQSLAFSARQLTYQNAGFTPLSQAVDFFQAQVDAYRPALRVGMPIADVQAGFVRLRDLLNGVSSQMSRLNPPVAVRQAGVEVLKDMREISEAVGVPLYGVDPGAPVLVNPPVGGPGWGFNPGTVIPPMPPSVAAADAAIVQVDAFLAGLQPMLLYSPTAPQLLSQARSLRAALAEFRADAANNVPNSYRIARMVAVNSNMTLTNALWNQTAQTVAIPSLAGVASAVQQLNQVYNQ